MAVTNRTVQVNLFTSPYGIQGPQGFTGSSGLTGPTGPTGPDISALYNLDFGQFGITVSNTLEFLIQASNIDLGSITSPNSVNFDGGVGFTLASGL